MKVKSLFMCMMLAMPLGFTACSNDTEEVLEPEVQNTVKGTDTRDVDDRPYYWYDGHKEYLSYVENTSFIVFYEKDKESLYNSLSELIVLLLKTKSTTHECILLKMDLLLIMVKDVVG